MNPTEVYSVTATSGTNYFVSPGYPKTFYFWRGMRVWVSRIGLFMGMFRSHGGYNPPGISLSLYILFFFFLSFSAGVERAQIPPLLEKLICFSFPL
jgi:hypothetical protein